MSAPRRSSSDRPPTRSLPRRTRPPLAREGPSPMAPLATGAPVHEPVQGPVQEPVPMPEPPAPPLEPPPEDPPELPPEHPPGRIDTGACDVRVLTVVFLVVTATIAAFVWYAVRDGRWEPATRTPAPSAASAVPPPPVPLPTDATYIQVRVLGSGDLAVQQWIRSRASLFGIDLVAPQDPALASGSVIATDLVVVADGVRVNGPTRTAGGPVSFSFFGAHSLYLRYRLSGALERSSTDSTRALARVTSLDLSYEPARGPLTIAFQGAQVLQVACTPRVIDVAPTPCGVQEGDEWLVRFPHSIGGYRVMAQLDLERPVS